MKVWVTVMNDGADGQHRTAAGLGCEAIARSAHAPPRPRRHGGGVLSDIMGLDGDHDDIVHSDSVRDLVLSSYVAVVVVIIMGIGMS